jgi:hypothetical protein
MREPAVWLHWLRSRVALRSAVDLLFAAFCSFLQLFAAFCSYFLVAYLCDVDLRRKDDFGAHYTNQPASHCRRYVAGCEAFAMS